MSELGKQQRVLAFLCVRRNSPHANAVIDARRCEACTVGTERESVKFLLRFFKRVQATAFCNIPHLDGAVATGTGEHFAISTESQLEDRAIVTVERAQFVAGRDIPELNSVVVAARREQLTIGT